MSTFLQLRTEVSDRGVLPGATATRIGAYVNRARARLDGMHTWAYREDSAQGVAPLSIPTLGIVEAVSNESLNYPLEPVGYADLTNWGCDLSLVGAAQVWYKATPAGAPVIATYPSNGDTIGVQFWRVPVDLVADADVPAAPSRFHGLYVDMAVQLAYRDSDNHQAAEALQVDIDRQVAQMVDELVSQNEPRFFKMSFESAADW